MCRMRFSFLFDSFFVVFVFVRFFLREVFLLPSAVGDEGCAKVLLQEFEGNVSRGATFVLGVAAVVREIDTTVVCTAVVVMGATVT